MIRSELDVLLDKVQDEALRTELRVHIDRLKQRRSFGLVFERHIPERVRLPQHAIRIGSQVVGRDDDDSSTWEVIAIEDGVATMVQVRDPDGSFLGRDEDAEMRDAALGSLVVISDFGEPVLPGFRHLGSVERGGDKPHHLVINGENHRALEAVRFTHAGKVDCIYIDPPYNTGARDWKYDNDYVDDTDAYRHSKWLAFMERRLKLARDLLNPDDSVLIVTIDEKEYLRLGMLLEQMFAGARVQMVSAVVNPAGVTRPAAFARTDEYLFFVFFGAAAAVPVPMDDEWRANPSDKRTTRILWSMLNRTGTNARRADRPNLFYPIFLSLEADRIVSVGEPLPPDQARETVLIPEGSIAVWPTRQDGSEGNWQVSPERLRAANEQGFVRLGKPSAKGASISYLKAGEIKKVADGTYVVVGRRADGSIIAENAATTGKKIIPTTAWRIGSHDAARHGSNLLARILPERRFPFPKSLYAVEDTIRFFVTDKPSAVVLDFFAGSGTTAHAVARLNKQDGGRRQSIMVTNNEVSADEAKELRSRGLRPGDPEWEALGIFEHITRPRVTAAITGRTPDGEPIRGDYKFTDEFPMADGFEENVAFLELRYLDADDVDLGLAYEDLAPLLWLRAGAQGSIARRVDDAGTSLPFDWTDHYGVLFDEDHWRAFVAARPDGATAAFIATWSPATFAGIAAELPTAMDVVRLYDTYLSLFLPERVGA